MARASYEQFLKNEEAAFNRAIEERTDPIKLRQCPVDLRFHGICSYSWSENRQLPRFYAIAVHCQRVVTNLYINEYVTVADIFFRLIKASMVTVDEALKSCLYSLDYQWTFELHETISMELNDPQLIVNVRDRKIDEVPLIIKDMCSRKYEIAAKLNDSVKTMKYKYFLLSDVPVNQQRIIFNTQQLDDEKKLSDYGIQQNSILTIVLCLRGGKPVIRLTSTKTDSITNVNVRLDLANDIWHLSSFYPTPSYTDHKSFVEWNDIEVYRNGRLCFGKQDHLTHFIHQHYPSIADEHEYRMLFWEALSHKDHSIFHLDNGLRVPRSDFIRVLNYLLKRMSLSSEDRDDMITYVIPHLDETDPNNDKTTIRFRFLSEEEYTRVASLKIRPSPTRITRAFLLYGFGDNDEQLSTIEEIDASINSIVNEYPSTSGLAVLEWGSMFIPFEVLPNYINGS